MSISKHSRKSGATTIKRDGKIVGNIGKGKGRIPTAEKTKISTINDHPVTNNYGTTLNKKNLGISHISKQFQMVTLKSHEYLSYDMAKILWELTEKQPKIERLNTLANYVDRIAPNGQRKIWLHIEETILAENKEDTRKLLLGNNGKVDEKILDTFCRYAKDLYVNIPLRYVLKNPELSAKTLDFLVKKGNTLISSYAVMHKNATSETLKLILEQSESFTSDQKLFVYGKISTHPHSDRNTLDYLYDIAKYGKIEEYLAVHPNVSKKTLEKLTHSEYREVKKKAIIRLENMEKERTNDYDTNN